MKKRRMPFSYTLMGIFLAVGMEMLSGCTRKTEESAGLMLLSGQQSVDDRETIGEDMPEAVPAEIGSEAGIGSKAEKMPAADTDRISQEAGECYVHICGAVKRPGVYCVQQGDRIFEVIAAAGGLLEDACGDYVNQAKTVMDGCRVWIPTMEEAQAAGWQYPQQLEMPEGSEADGGLVNINTASSEQLCTLSGIGKSKAEAVIAYRNEHGAFARTEDIMKVAGIKQSGYDKIKDQITVGRE